MEATETLVIGLATTNQSPTAISFTAVELVEQTFVENSHPVKYAASDPKSIAQTLQVLFPGSQYVPFARVEEYVRLNLLLMGETDGTAGKQGIEDLYLIMRGEYNGQQYVWLVDLGRVTWTFGLERVSIGTTQTTLYWPLSASLDSSEGAKALSGGLTELQTYPVAAYARAGSGRPAMVALFDKGPAIGLLRVMSRVGTSGINTVTGAHQRWR